ncbi:MAG: Rrf2 family transcriptional regulator [Bacteroidales bacterium]|nr:Rrf2 family transcriptional regulator [Bacteroidales bacterium]
MSNLFHISEMASLGIHSMAIIAANDEKLNVTQIAEILKACRNSLAKVMHLLVKNGYVTSDRGPKSGFKMKKDAEDVSLLDIYEAIEGKLEPEICGIEEDRCPFDECLFGGMTNKYVMEFREYLANKKLSKTIETYNLSTIAKAE